MESKNNKNEKNNTPNNAPVALDPILKDIEQGLAKIEKRYGFSSVGDSPNPKGTTRKKRMDTIQKDLSKLTQLDRKLLKFIEAEV